MVAATSPDAATWRNFAPSSIIWLSIPRATTWIMVRAPMVQSARMRSISARPRGGVGDRSRGERAVQDQVAHALRVSRRVHERRRAAERPGEDRHLLAAQRLDHRLEVRDPLDRRDVAHLAIGEARAAPVEAHDAAPAVAREPVEEA